MEGCQRATSTTETASSFPAVPGQGAAGEPAAISGGRKWPSTSAASVEECPLWVLQPVEAAPPPPPAGGPGSAERAPPPVKRPPPKASPREYGNVPSKSPPAPSAVKWLGSSVPPEPGSWPPQKATPAPEGGCAEKSRPGTPPRPSGPPLPPYRPPSPGAKKSCHRATGDGRVPYVVAETGADAPPGLSVSDMGAQTMPASTSDAGVQVGADN